MDIHRAFACLTPLSKTHHTCPINAPKEAHETKLHAKKDASKLVTLLLIPLRPTTCQTKLS
jgi:hypothetical protein